MKYLKIGLLAICLLLIPQKADAQDFSLFNRSANINTNVESAKISGSTLYIEGVAYLEKINTPNYSDVQSMQLTLKPVNGGVEKIYTMGTSKKYPTTKRYGNGKYNYNVGSYATPGYKGINLNKLEPGTYVLNLKMIARGYEGQENIWISTNKNINQKGYTTGYEYHLYRSGNQIYLKKTDLILNNNDANISTNVESAKMSGSTLYIEGVGYIPYVTSVNYEDVSKMELSFIPVNGGQETKYLMGASKKYPTTKNYGKGIYNYDVGTYATPSYKGINLNNLEAGTYVLNLSITTRGYTGKENIWISTNKNINSKAYVTGYEYHLYREGNQLFLNKKDLIVNDQAATLNTKVEDVYFANNKLYLDGVSYLKYVNTPNYSDVSNIKLILKQNGSLVHETTMAASKKYPTTKNYGEGKYNYDVGSFTTVSNNGIDLSNYQVGTFQLSLKFTTPSYQGESNLWIPSGNNINESITIGSYKYTIYSQNNGLYLKKEANMTNNEDYIIRVTDTDGNFIQNITTTGQTLDCANQVYLLQVDYNDNKYTSGSIRRDTGTAETLNQSRVYRANDYNFANQVYILLTKAAGGNDVITINCPKP